MARRMLMSPERADSDDIFKLTESDFKNAAVSLRYEMLQANSSESPESSESGDRW